MRWLFACALLAACSAGTKPRVHKPGEEYLAAIRIEGNTAIASEDLVPGLALQRAAEAQRSLDDYQLQLDKARVETAYHKRGFFAVQVHTRVEHHGDAATAVFAVTEGPRAITHVVFVGLPPEVPEASARALVPLAEGAPFDYDVYEDAKEPLTELVENAGYAHAALEASVIADRTHGQATVEYSFVAGPRCTFGDVSIEGVDGMLADAIRARLAFQPGEPYSAQAVIDTQTSLYRFGRFSTVRVRPRLGGDDVTVPVRIGVGLPDANEARVGVGGGFDAFTYFARLHLSYTRTRFLTPLTTFSVDARPEYALVQESCSVTDVACGDFRLRLLATLTQQDLFHTDYKGEAEVGFDYLPVEAYTLTGPHVRLGLTMPLGTPRLQLRLGWRYAYNDFSDIHVADAAELGIDHPNSVGSYSATLALDLRDKPIEPQRGFYAELRAIKGTPYAGGDFRYLQLTPEVRGFFTLAGTTLAARARFGTITGDVPETERYYGGGMASQRGFASRRLSPVDPVTGIVIGGTALLETSLELRRPINDDFGALVFLDGGDVTNSVSSLDFLHQHWAIGVGLRYLSSIGPLGVALAYRLNRTGPGEPEAGNHFQPLITLGEAF